MNKVLLHTCCAVCFSHPSNKLQEDGFEVIPYFYNPNIYPFEEYKRRLEELIKIAPNTIIEENNPQVFYNYTEGLENEPEKGKRCLKCFELRLIKTAQKAKELKIKNFTTTLTVSPHKISNHIFEIGEKIAKDFDLNFLKYDFKKQDGFKITQKIATEKNLYKQLYCGCEYSIKKL
ncbi:MAG: epoxyqueuosine reductase QueH [Cyanobacteria bacterium SIG30]|nr:epoxyqueuosine reductase QueH [Cyanobacteria bacterium SIG30]